MVTALSKNEPENKSFHKRSFLCDKNTQTTKNNHFILQQKGQPDDFHELMNIIKTSSTVQFISLKLLKMLVLEAIFHIS